MARRLRRLREKIQLHLAGHREIVLQAFFLVGDALVEARVLNRDGNRRRQRCHGALVVFREEAAARVLQVEHADDFALVDERHAELGARLGIQADVARVFGYVRHQDRFAVGRGVAHEAAIERDVVLELHALLEAQREAVLQFLLRLIEQQDAEHLVVNDLRKAVGDAFEQLVEVQDGGEFFADVEEQAEVAGLARHAGVEARVLDGDGDARGDDGEDAAVLFGEVAALGGLQVEHADDAVLDDERNCQLGAHARMRVDVAGEARHVGHEHGFTALGGAANHAFAHFDAQLFHVGRVADLEAHAQVLRLLVEQHDAEDFVVYGAAHEFGDAFEQRGEVERGVDRVDDLEQEGFQIERRSAWFRSSAVHADELP